MILLKVWMNRMLIRFSDVIFSLFGLIFFAPLFILIAVWIKIDSKGPVIFRQTRVGRLNRDFTLLKFRTMYVDAHRKGLITVGAKDPRVTNAGSILRRYKLDELPQLWNVLIGEMSFVGPRPEVRRYVDLFSPADQSIVFSVKPGITDFASIQFSDENEILSNESDPEAYYIHQLIPAKIRLNMIFIERPTLGNYFKIIFRTVHKVISR